MNPADPFVNRPGFDCPGHPVSMARGGGVIMECLHGAAIIAVFWLVVVAAYQLAVRLQPRG